MIVHTRRRKVRNIVQAEFFHVGGVDTTFQQLKMECEERAMVDAPLKTTVRFFDEGGFVTEFVKQYETNALLPSQLLLTYRGGSFWRKLRIGLFFHYRYAKTSLLEERLFHAQDAFFAIAETTRVIAVERPDRSFRPLRDDELYDVKTAVSRAKTAWLFVFAGNELCGESTTLIASAV